MIRVRLRHAFATAALDVAFEAGPGVTALYGPSGAGKTSVLRAVAGLLAADRAEVEVAGRDLAGRPPEARGIGYVFQEARLFPHLTVAGNLDFAARVGRPPPPDLRARLVALLDLAPLLDRRPRGLSGGEANRVALARALLSAPDLLCLDEPLAALDARRKADAMAYLERVRDEVATPMLYVTHDIAEVARLSDTLVLIDAGRVVRHGPTADLLGDPAAVPLLGPRAAGAVLRGRVTGHDAHLTRLDMGGAELRLPRLGTAVGRTIRVRIAAQDVILSTTRPEGLSANNVLPVRIEAIHEGTGPGLAVALRMGEARLLARITRPSAVRMGLAPGMEVWAIVNATAFAPEGVGT
ncbi:MAG: molybdenum ABC transporter ATP-binding protein [Shimia sp.]